MYIFCICSHIQQGRLTESTLNVRFSGVGRSPEVEVTDDCGVYSMCSINYFHLMLKADYVSEDLIPHIPTC